MTEQQNEVATGSRRVRRVRGFAASLAPFIGGGLTLLASMFLYTVADLGESQPESSPAVRVATTAATPDATGADATPPADPIGTEAASILGDIRRDVIPRLMWATTYLTLVVVIIATIVACTIMIVSSLTRCPARDGAIMGGGAVVVLGIVLIILAANRDMFKFSKADELFGAIMWGPIADELTNHLFVGVILSTLLIMLTMSFVLLSTARIEQLDAQWLAGRMRAARVALYLGTALLVGCVLELLMLYRAPAMARPETHGDFSLLASTLSGCFGVFFSLFLLATYLPASLVLDRRAVLLARRVAPGRGASRERRWVRTHGLRSSAPQHIVRTFAIFAPVLASFIDAPLLKLVGLAGGG